MLVSYEDLWPCEAVLFSSPASREVFQHHNLKTETFFKKYISMSGEQRSRASRLSQWEWGCFPFQKGNYSFQKSNSLFCVVLLDERRPSEANCCNWVSYPRKTVFSDGKSWLAENHSCSVRSHYDEGLPAQAICPSLGACFCFAFFFFFLLLDAVVNHDKIKPRGEWSLWGWALLSPPCWIGRLKSKPSWRGDLWTMIQRNINCMANMSSLKNMNSVKQKEG